VAKGPIMSLRRRFRSEPVNGLWRLLPFDPMRCSQGWRAALLPTRQARSEREQFLCVLFLGLYSHRVSTAAPVIWAGVDLSPGK